MKISKLLSVSLGSVETSLLNITAGYASFVNGGSKIKPTLINRIQDRRGELFTLQNLLNVKVVIDFLKTAQEYAKNISY